MAANYRVLLVIGLFLASLHSFMEPSYCIDRISERHQVPISNSNWKKDSIQLNGGSSRKLKVIVANPVQPLVLTVDKVGGPGIFTTLGQAIDAVPLNNINPVVINVKPGIYSEKVTIPAEKPFITLIGMDAKSTIITWNDSAESTGGTYNSATVTVLASDFTAKQIAIQNSHGPSKHLEGDQTVALKISGDRCAFYDCSFLGYQDTVLDDRGRHYFRNCFIEGAGDVICGNGKSIYENCELHAIPIDNGAFTAQKRSSLSDDSGFVFLQCKLTGKGLMYLGRAWGPYSTTLFANTYMEDIIIPEGWENLNDPLREKTVLYGQYQCEGPGAIANNRVPWSHTFNDTTQIGQYLNISYIDGNTWIKPI
eukprot:PITA_26480